MSPDTIHMCSCSHCLSTQHFIEPSAKLHTTVLDLCQRASFALCQGHVHTSQSTTPPRFWRAFKPKKRSRSFFLENHGCDHQKIFHRPTSGFITLISAPKFRTQGTASALVASAQKDPRLQSETVLVTRSIFKCTRTLRNLLKHLRACRTWQRTRNRVLSKGIPLHCTSCHPPTPPPTVK